LRLYFQAREPKRLTSNQEDPFLDEHLVTKALTFAFVRPAGDRERERRVGGHLVQVDRGGMHDGHGREELLCRFSSIGGQDLHWRDVPRVEIWQRQKVHVSELLWRY
jgi:hypothetical protein